MINFLGKTLLLVSLMATGCLSSLSPQSARAADCGQPPLPPCAGQGSGEDQSTTSPSSTSSPSATSSSSSSCGPPPLPPCQGQGVGETNQPSPTATSSQPAESSTTDPVGNTSAFSNYQVSGSNTALVFSFTTNQPAKVVVSLVDQLSPGDRPRTVQNNEYTENHVIDFSQYPLYSLFPENGVFAVSIVATTETGETLRADADKIDIAFTDGKPKIISLSSDSTGQSDAGDDEIAREGLPVDSILRPLVDDILDEPLFGTQGYRRLDGLAWLYYLLIIATIGLGTYFFIKRRRLWGIVYDARTKVPVEMAVVRLFDQEHHKLLETRVTPKSGRYSFLGEPGEYYLEVTKGGYHFPSRIVTQTIDNEYSNLYRGEVVKLGTGQSLVAPDIPIDSESGEVKQASFYRRVVFPLLDKVRLPIVLLAFILTPFFFYLANYGYFNNPWGFFASSFVVVIFLISELLFVRRGRK